MDRFTSQGLLAPASGGAQIGRSSSQSFSGPTQFPPPGAGVDRSPVAYWGKRLILVTLAAWAASFAVGFQTGLSILTITGFVAAVVGIRKPALGLLGVSMLCTLDGFTRSYLLTGGLLRYNTFNYWLLVVMVISIPFLLSLRDAQTRILQVFIALLALELAWTSDWVSGVQHVLNITVVFGLLAYFNRNARRPEIWYWMGLLNGVLAGLGTLVFNLRQESLPGVDPNAWSFFPLAAVFAIALAFVVGRVPRRRRLPLVLLAALNATWVFLSGSRGSFLISVGCLVVIVLQTWRSGGALPILGVAALVSVLVGSQFIERKAVAVHRLDKLLDSQRSLTGRTSGRSDLALGGWYIFLDNPFGIGTGGFAYAWVHLRDRRGLSSFKEGVYMQAHSGWIKVLAENGVPGILLLSGFILSFAMIGWRRRRQGLFLLGLLVTVSLCVAFVPDEFQGKGIWFLVAAAMTLMRPAAGSARSSRTPGIASGEIDGSMRLPAFPRASR